MQVENSQSADEAGEEAPKSDSDKPRLRGRPGRSKRGGDKNRVNPSSDSAENSVTSASGIRIETKPDGGKEESGGLLGRGDGSNIGGGGSGTGVNDVDSGEFSDAVSELEPLQGQRFKPGSRSRHASENESSIQSHIQQGASASGENDYCL